MHANFDEILEAAMQLSEKGRLAIAMNLPDSLPDSPPGLAMDRPDLLEEMDRRRQEIEATFDVPFSELWQRD